MPELKKLPPPSPETALKWLSNRVARLKRLIELEAPPIIVEREKELIRDALDALPKNEEAIAELAAGRAKKIEDEPHIIARAEQLYREAGNTIPWDDVDAIVQHGWAAKVIEEELDPAVRDIIDRKDLH